MNWSLLAAAETVQEAVEREGQPCGVKLINPDGEKICDRPWNHSPPHSWEPAELQKKLSQTSVEEIHKVLRDSQRLAPWAAELCRAELDHRVEPPR